MWKFTFKNQEGIFTSLDIKKKNPYSLDVGNIIFLKKKKGASREILL